MNPAARKLARTWLAATNPLPPTFPETEMGLQTVEEFIQSRNPGGKYHEQSSYDPDLSALNRDNSISVVNTSRIDGEDLVLRETKYGHFSKHDGKLVAVIHKGTLYYETPYWKTQHPSGFHPRYPSDAPFVDLEIQRRVRVKYLSEVMPLVSDAARRNKARYTNLIQHIKIKGEPYTVRSEPPEKGSLNGITIGIFNAEGLKVASAQNEWGATLLLVAKEYRGLGLGQIIGKLWYKWNPARGSGGFTDSGQANAVKIWQERVREFLSWGWYSAMVAEGRITPSRVREILKGVGERRTPRKEDPPTSKKKPGLLVYSAYPVFVVYDRAFLDDQDEDYIYGTGFFSSGHVGDFIYRIEYERPYAELVTSVALQMAKDEGLDLWIGQGYGDMIEYEGIAGVEIDGDYLRQTKDLLPLKTLARKESLTRKSTDPFSETHVLLLEMSESKWS